jgi:hypothetical protein
MKIRAARSIGFILMAAFFILCNPMQRPAYAAIGCTLSNPAQDLKYLFPEMTSYKEELRNLSKMKDGKSLYASLSERLGSDLDRVYETYETPYTIYTVFKGQLPIGYVHGVNVPGQGGLIQIFLSTDPKTGGIRRMFFQRLESRASRALRNNSFLDQFKDLSLGDFYQHEYYKVVEPGSVKDRIVPIKNPVADEKAKADFDASLRGVRKNLILLDFFVYERRFEPIYQQAKAVQAKAKE